MSRWSGLAEVSAFQQAEKQHGLMSWEQLKALGMSRRTLHRRLRSGKWKSLFRNVYRLLPSKVGNWHQWLMATCLWLGPDAAISHGAAARLHQLDGSTDEADLEVTLLRAHRGKAHPAVRIHRSSYPTSENITTVEGIRCTTLARTLLDVSHQWPEDNADAAVDCALRQPKMSVKKLNLWIAKFKARGMRGLKAFRELLDGRGNKKPFDAESERWFSKNVLEPNGFPKPVHNYPLYDENGKEKYRVDCVWEQLGIAIELHSRKHHTGAKAVRHDTEKANAIVMAGLKPFVFWREDVLRDPSPIVTLLHEAIALAETG